MSPPKRWLDDAGTPDDERALLRAGLAMDPPADAQGAVWAALLAKVPPPVPPSPPPSPSPTAAPPPGGAAAGAAKAGAAVGGAAVGAGIFKSVLIGAGSALVVIAGYAVLTPSPPPTAAPPASTATPAATVAAPDPPRASPGAAAPNQAPEPSATVSSALDAPGPSASADHRAPPPDRETLLREESRLLSEARDALRGGDATRALGLLEQLRARFPGGVLAQEREALTIEALARSGLRDEAAGRAAAFLRAYPTSPLTARVQTFAR